MVETGLDLTILIPDWPQFISFVSGLQSSLGPVVSEFRNLCNPDRSFNTAAISALGELMSRLAQQFGDKTGAGARGQEFISNIVVSC